MTLCLYHEIIAIEALYTISTIISYNKQYKDDLYISLVLTILPFTVHPSKPI